MARMQVTRSLHEFHGMSQLGEVDTYR
jgi:hypothetical protein